MTGTVWDAALRGGKATSAHADLLEYLRTLVYPTDCELRLGRVGATIPPPGAGDGSDLPLDEWPLAAVDGQLALDAVRVLNGPPRDIRALGDQQLDQGLTGVDTTLPVRFVMPGDHLLGSDHPGARPTWLADGYRLTAVIADAGSVSPADHSVRRMRIVFPRATYRCRVEGVRIEHRLELEAGTVVPLYTARAAGETAR